MENPLQIWDQLLLAQRHAKASKWRRWRRWPIRYPVAILFSIWLYPRFKKDWRKTVTTFFGMPFMTRLPSGTDIWLNGIKSHDSEIRLAKFLTRNVSPGQTFIDIGAHYGYYSLLASTLVGETGKVISVEASGHSFELLHLNTSGVANIEIFHRAAGDRQAEIVFYEYPGPYAEYNTMIGGQYASAAWRKKVKETITRVDTLLIDDLFHEKQIMKAVIKMDIEGGEFKALQGASQTLHQREVILAIEYLRSPDRNSPHHQAAELLKQKGYIPYRITDEGELEKIKDIDQYLTDEKLDSDNLVFARP